MLHGMMRLSNVVILFFVFSILLMKVQGNSTAERAQQNNTNEGGGLSPSSPWLKKITNHDPRPRPPGCWKRSWICKQGQQPGTRMRCCKNQCVDILSDVNHCGLCGIRCPFTRRCCKGFCVNTNFNPFHCGRCGNRCPWRVRCLYGMCGYAQSSPPRPCPPPSPTPPQTWPPRILEN
ncbi:stigma-specific STIG1-like protein 4 [Tripterygium wilfordii]|uniref:stigma-specific STIG1-like protein 4 n=1 Tax=Tripterygium wilfordii TaxID=458696 RepID=UPI0018F813C9|nr:stigma-specific STIG1-like protein 4 [Tripterygium wilfordii]